MILLGNLTVEQMEKRCGITLKDEERNALDALREETCDKVRGNNKMHIAVYQRYPKKKYPAMDLFEKIDEMEMEGANEQE